VLSSKLNISLLSEHEDSDLFTLEEREIIKTYIPWTRKTVPGLTTYKGEPVRLEDLVTSARERLVLKPSQGYAVKVSTWGVIQGQASGKT